MVFAIAVVRLLLLWRLNVHCLVLNNYLKVDGNEKLGGREGDSKSASVWHCGDWRLFAIWTCSSPVNNLFPFPLATAKSIGDVWMNRQSGVKMLLLVVTCNCIYIGEDIFISWIGVADRICRMTIRFTLYRLIKKSINCANTIGAVRTERNILTPLRLFVVTMPI